MVEGGMGGARNGRFFKWSLAVMLALCVVYAFYVYRGVSSLLREKEKELHRLEELQSLLGDQLKDLAQSHTSLQDELKTERVNHHRTRMEKGSLDKQCQADLKSLKESAESEKDKLEQDRDLYKTQLEEEKGGKKRLQEQQDSLLSRYDQDISACEEEKQKQEEALSSCREDTAKANGEQQRAETVYSQCSDQLQSLQHSLQVKEAQEDILHTKLVSCQRDLQTLTSKKQEMEQEMEELKQRKAPERKVTLTEKEALYKALSDKVGRGEKLSEKELRALTLLEGGHPQQGNQNLDPRGARDLRGNSPPNDRQGEQFYKSHRSLGDYQERPLNHRRLPGYDPQGGMKSEPGRLPGGGGMGTRRDGEKQQLPELAEQEEVKELQVDEQDQGVVEKRGEKGEGEDDQGVDEQAFDPAEKEGGEKEEEEEEGREYDFDHVQDNPVENLNLPVPGGGRDGGQPPMPHPQRVLAEEEGEDDRVHSPPKFENPDKAFDNPDQLNEQEELEREQEGRQDALEKDYANDDDEFGHRQFDEDVRLDREERMRVKAIPGRGGVQQEWNGDQGDMEQGQVDDAMKQEMNENDLRRKEVGNQLEKDELLRRLNKPQQQQPHFGQRDNLR